MPFGYDLWHFKKPLGRGLAQDTLFVKPSNSPLQVFMTFSLSGTTITQTGYDSSLAGLNGISGVTVTGQSSGKLHYTLTGRQLVLNGTLIIDPEVECLEFDTTSALPNLTYNSRFQIGRKRASAGEVTTIATTAATGLGGKYFTFHDGTTAFYVWFTVNGIGTNPSPGGTGILCAVLGTDTNAQVATKIEAAIMSIATLSMPLVNVSVLSNVVTISNNRNVTATDATAATSGFTVTVTQQGSAAGTIRYSDGDAIIFSRITLSWAAEHGLACTTANSVFLGYGGRINSGLALSFCGGTASGGPTNGLSLVGHVFIERLHFFGRIGSTSPTGGLPAIPQVRFQHVAGSTVNVSGLTLDCESGVTADTPSVLGSRNVGFTSFSAIFKSFQLQNFSALTPTAGDFTFDDLVFGSNFRPYDVIGNYATTFGAAVPVWTFRNTDIGTATRIFTNVTSTVDTGKLNAVWTQTVNARLSTAANNPITSNALIWLTERNDGARFEAVGRTGFNWTTVQSYSQAVDGTGQASVSVRLGIAYVSRDAGPVNTLNRSYFGKTTDDDFDIYAIGYLYNIASGTHILRGINGYTYTQPMVTDASITQTTRATVDAYTTLDTPQQFYDRAKSWLVSNYAGQTSVLVTRLGNTIDAGTRNVVIDATAAAAFSVAGSTITIKSSAFVGNLTTTGTITLANGATFTGQRTDSTGTITSATFTISNIISGSRLLIRRTDTQFVLVNQAITGTSFTYVYLHTTNIPVEIVVRKATGSPTYQEWRTTATLTSSGGSATANQVLDE
jgi:hypothetical protein